MSLKALMHKVTPHYPVTDGWRATTPWELVEGRYQRWFRTGMHRDRSRRAMIYRSAGGWRWRVLELRKRGVTVEVGKSAGDMVYTTAYNAFNAAETSAQTK